MPIPPTDPTLLDSLAGYPRWLVAAGLTVGGVLAIWIVAKILKVALNILMVLVFVGGVAATLWYLLH